MNDALAIALTALAWSLGAGLVLLLVAYLLRRRSLRLATTGVAVVAVGVMVSGLVGTSRSMFISRHDLGVATEVVVVSGLAGLLFAVAVGENLVRRARDVQREARRFGTTGEFGVPAGNLPAELTALSTELERAAARLEEAQDRQRRLEESRRELVAWVSHDLRTPLAGMRAMAEALQDGMVADPARYHARIAGEVERMGRMVDDLFELSRIESGSLVLTPEPLPVSDLVSEVLASADALARGAGVRLSGSAPAVLVDADPDSLRRVLLNLVGNAVRHTPAGGEVTVTGRQGDGATPDVELVVTDACGGIPEADLPRVFDAGWRGTPERTPSPLDADEPRASGRGSGGAGLGLAIVKGVVEAHHGSVSVANHADGCRFVVRLPAGPAGPPAQDTRVRVTSTNESPLSPPV